MQKKGTESVRKSAGYHVWQEKSYINTARGTSGRTPVLGRKKSRCYSRFHSKGKATMSQMVRNSSAAALCPVWDYLQQERHRITGESPENSIKEIKKAQALGKNFRLGFT